MNKKVLIISPYFPPSNAADMQRIRMSLPYFKDFGWDAEVVIVGSEYSEMLRDELLLKSVPADIKIHTVKAFSKKWTSKFGLGSIALRSLWFYRKKVNQLLKQSHFDLIYFSTTQFPVCILGAGWKKRFNIPYVIDMQDPWHSEYYRDKPKEQQPAKYWFSYRLNKYLEPIAMKQVDGLISVSENYIADLKARYPEIKDIPAETIPFGAFAPDFEIAKNNQQLFEPLLDPRFTNIVYMGRGGADMHPAITVLFKALKNLGQKEPGIFKKVRVHFIGTSYAPKGKGKPTIMPLALQLGIEDNIIEVTDRISYYHTLATLKKADALFIPGSDDPKYSASKIYPYLLTKKPVLAIFNSKSPALKVLDTYDVKSAYSYDETPEIELKTGDFIKQVVNGEIGEQEYKQAAIQQYSSENVTKLQCRLFDAVINSQTDYYPNNLIEKIKVTFGFIISHPMGKRHIYKSFFRFIMWQIQSSLYPNKFFIKPFLKPVKFYARKRLTGITGNIYTGLHEFYEMTFLLHFLQPGDVFFDIGANVGSYILLASGVCKAKSIAIEPVRSTFEILSKNIELNQLESRVSVINSAAGAERGEISFTLNEDTTNHVAAGRESGAEVTTVPVLAIDSLTGENMPILVKIDVEGFETEVLKGMNATLDLPLLRAIIIELNGSGARYGYSEDQVHHLLLSKGFKPHTYDPFKRLLSEIPIFGNDNTIYCRDLDFINERLQIAGGINIMGEVI